MVIHKKDWVYQVIAPQASLFNSPELIEDKNSQETELTEIDLIKRRQPN